MAIRVGLLLKPIYYPSIHHTQKIQGISPHVSAGPLDQSTQFGHLSHLDPRYHSRIQETTTPSNVV
jgi:hypothetical protein